MFFMFGGGLSRGDYERSRFRARGERRDRYFFLLIFLSKLLVVQRLCLCHHQLMSVAME
jgi:hypothetical protein